MQKEVEINCLECNEAVVLSLVGGQYQETWIGDCTKCGKRWVLESPDEEEDEEYD